MLDEEQPENDLHEDAEGLQIDRPLERSRREKGARLSRIREEEQASDQRHEQGGQEPGRQTAPVLEEPFDGERARDGKPANETEPGHAGDTPARRPADQDGGQDHDLGDEQEVGQLLHRRASAPRAAEIPCR